MRSAGEKIPQQLRDLVEQLGEAFRKAEEQLKALGLGVRAEVLLPSPPGGALVFGKLAKQWRLLYRPEGRGHRDTIPLQSASRQVRLSAARLLPELVQALSAAAESELARVQSATEEVRAFCEAVQASKSG